MISLPLESLNIQETTSVTDIQYIIVCNLCNRRFVLLPKTFIGKFFTYENNEREKYTSLIYWRHTLNQR